MNGDNSFVKYYNVNIYIIINALLNMNTLCLSL